MRKNFLLLMLLSLLPLAGFAQTASGIYRITTGAGNTATIVGLVETVQASEVTTLTIPAKLGKDADPEYYTVVGVGNFVAGATPTQKAGIQSIVIAANSCATTGIAANAFEGLTNLTSVTIGNKVATIGQEAFKGCSKLEFVNLTAASALTTVNKNAFQGTKIGTLDFTATKLANAKIWFNNSNASLTTVKFPTTLASIDAKAFMGCTALNDVQFNKANTTPSPQAIGESAFAGTDIANLNLTNTNVAIIENLFGSFFAYNALPYSDGDDTDVKSAVYHNAYDLESALGLPLDAVTPVTAAQANAYYTDKGFMTISATTAFTEAECINYAYAAAISTIKTGDIAAAGDVFNAVVAACEAKELAVPTVGNAYTATQVYTYVATLENALKTTDNKIFANVVKYNAVKEVTCIIGADGIILAGNKAIAIAYNAGLDGAVVANDAANYPRIPKRDATPNNTLITVTLPATMTTLGVEGESIPGAFENCKALTTVNFTTPSPANLAQAINAKAFLGCPLTNGLDLTNTNITVIKSNIIRDGANVTLNSKLASVVLPAKLEQIQDNAFNSCIALSDINFDACVNLTTIGNYVFGTTASLEEIDLTKCVKLKNFTNDGSATVDGTKDVAPFVPNALGSNTELTTLKLTANFNYIGKAFANLKALTNTGNNISSTKIVKLSANSLVGTDALTELTLPTQCATIEATGKTGLTKLVIQSTTPTMAAPSFTMAAAANSSVEFKNIEDGVNIAPNAIVGAGAGYATSLKIGAIKTALANNIISNNVGSAETGAITAAVNTAIFGTATSLKVASIGESGSLTGGDVANTTLTSLEITGGVVANGIKAGSFSDHQKLAVINFKGALVASAVAAGAFGDDDSWAGSAAEVVDGYKLVVEYKPANHTAAFNANAFADGGYTGSVNVKLNTNRKFKVGQAAIGALTRVFISAPAAEATIDLARKATTSPFFYGKFIADGDSKIAKENGAQNVICYGAYLDESDATIYMEQLRVVGGFYYIPDGAPVIVKLAAAADNSSTTAQIIAVGDELGTNNSLNYANPALPVPVNEICYTTDEETIGLTLMNNDNDVDWAARPWDNTQYTLYAMAKPEKYDMTWKKFAKTTSLPKGTFYVHSRTFAAASELKVVWTDDSEETLTGIETVKTAEQEMNGEIFNLQGIRVNGAKKGMYIMNGKKFIKK